jgi:phosphoenolpyruvate synthase/pyruvate phosphate dikinase
MYVAWLKDLRMTDLAQVGGKNASLGEMIGGLSAAGVAVFLGAAAGPRQAGRPGAVAQNL